MTKESTRDIRIWCDGCNEAMLEYSGWVSNEEEYGQKLLDEHGWQTTENREYMHLCPTCRADTHMDHTERERLLNLIDCAVVSAQTLTDQERGWNEALAMVLRVLDGADE